MYGEFGVESVIPPAKAGLYTGTEPVSTHPVDEQTQAAYYAQARKLAYCQPNVFGVMIFHVSDESALAGWQSGPNYADDTAKASLAGLRDAADASRSGTLTTCPDQTAPTVALTQAPADGSTVHGSLALAQSADAKFDPAIRPQFREPVTLASKDGVLEVTLLGSFVPERLRRRDARRPARRHVGGEHRHRQE